MHRINVNINEEQIHFLQKLNTLSTSEHIRRALDEYIAKTKKEGITTSPSKRKKVD